jgi:dolichol-phosphate mannosyltransferase
VGFFQTEEELATMDGPFHHVDPAGRSLSLVIPAFNEEAGIRQAVEEADQAVGQLASQYEIIVVDDGSSDGTSKLVQEASMGRPQIRLLRHQHNLGYSAALRTGFEVATGERVAFTDADCQFHLVDLASLLSLAERHPVAVGFRLDRKDPWSRRFFSWGYNVLVRTLLGTGVRDCDCALKVFRRDALMMLLPEAQGFFVNTEMLTRARQLGYSVAETGVRHRPRLRGVSKVSLGDIPRTLATLLPFWWSRVMFPAPHSTLANQHSADRRSWILDLGFWTVFLVAMLLFFARIRSPLLEPDEARYAEIPRQMLHQGNWIVPVLHGQPYYHEPPLLYWLVMGSYSIFGVKDWAARLVPCLASIGLVLVSYVWGRSLMNKRAALAGALILCLSSRFVYLGRMLTMDSLLCLWVVSSLAMAHLALRAASTSWIAWLLSAFFCGLGLLTKGPVALVLVIVPVLAWQALDRRTARATLKSWLIYVSIAAGVAIPWYAAVAWQDPAFAPEFIWTHHVLRFVSPIDHAEPFWFFIPGLILGMLPWTLLLIPFARYLMLRSGVLARRRSASLGFLLLASLCCLLFFSLGGCKRPSYILPAMPPLALALGCYVDDTSPKRKRGIQAAPSLALRARMPAGLRPRWSFAFQRFPDSWSLAGAGTFVVLLLALHQLLPGYARKFSMRAQVRPNQHLSADPKVPVICYPHGWDSVSFYLRRNDVRAYAPEQRRALIADLRSQPKTLVFVKSERYLREFERALPASLEFVPRGRQGNVTAGVVQHRAEVPSTVFAQR